MFTTANTSGHDADDLAAMNEALDLLMIEYAGPHDGNHVKNMSDAILRVMRHGMSPDDIVDAVNETAVQ